MLAANEARSMLLRMISLNFVARRLNASAVSGNAGQSFTESPNSVASASVTGAPSVGADPSHRLAEDQRIQRAGHLVFDVGLVAAVRGDQRLVVEIEPVASRPRAQGVGDAGLPVDQRAVAVEAHRLEAIEVAHVFVPFPCCL